MSLVGQRTRQFSWVSIQKCVPFRKPICLQSEGPFTDVDFEASEPEVLLTAEERTKQEEEAEPWSRLSKRHHYRH